MSHENIAVVGTEPSVLSIVIKARKTRFQWDVICVARCGALLDAQHSDPIKFGLDYNGVNSK
jgi:hypothetical protein